MYGYPIEFKYQGRCMQCGKWTNEGSAAANGLVLCVSCFQANKRERPNTASRPTAPCASAGGDAAIPRRGGLCFSVRPRKR